MLFIISKCVNRIHKETLLPAKLSTDIDCDLSHTTVVQYCECDMSKKPSLVICFGKHFTSDTPLLEKHFLACRGMKTSVVL